MTATTPTRTAPAGERKNLSRVPARPNEARREQLGRPLSKEEADRAFEAGVRWFLAVSRLA